MQLQGINTIDICLFLPRDATQSAVLPRQVVCPSVTLRYRAHILRSKIISQLVRLWCSLSADPNMMDLLQGKNSEILAGIGVGYGKMAFGVQKV